jgi:hypothetical protein
MVEKVVPIWMGAVEAAVELMWENRIEGDELEASWELLEPYGPEAIKKGKELYREKLRLNSQTQAQPSIGEPKAKIDEPKAKAKVRWKQTSDGNWWCSIDGGIWRRGFGSPPKHLLKPTVELRVVEQRKPEPEPEPEPEPGAEAEPDLEEVVKLNVDAPYDIAKTCLRRTRGGSRQETLCLYWKDRG